MGSTFLSRQTSFIKEGHKFLHAGGKHFSVGRHRVESWGNFAVLLYKTLKHENFLQRTKNVLIVVTLSQWLALNLPIWLKKEKGIAW